MVYIREAHPTDGWKMESNEKVGVSTKQPTSYPERVKVCEQMVSLLETGYDWDAIAADAADDLGFDWSPSWGKGQVPGHVVCSSLACYAYDEAGLKRPPGNARTDQPADWDEWIISRGWLP